MSKNKDGMHSKILKKAELLHSPWVYAEEYKAISSNLS